MRAHNQQSGFSLIEVTLALVVVSVGLLGIFHLFPAGLRASADATAETRCGQFADEVFNQIYAEAAAATNTAGFGALFGLGGTINIGTAPTIKLNGFGKVQYPILAEANLEEYIRYKATSILDADGRRASVELNLLYGGVGGFTNTFYTEVYNFGM
ncbi:MAG: prepilin-type N-terminal cleavage/methylation domain-containing protein [Lentisphaerae bacterium]|nr:prepilin-type N-terminal cleavage/methylation domain-containing protein [Lentisphaerota bacterium]